MELELYPLLSTVILVASIVTIVFALFSYLAYRAREKRLRPKSPLQLSLSETPVTSKAQYFRRYDSAR
jgi:hypothetical protein